MKFMKKAVPLTLALLMAASYQNCGSPAGGSKSRKYYLNYARIDTADSAQVDTYGAQPIFRVIPTTKAKATTSPHSGGSTPHGSTPPSGSTSRPRDIPEFFDYSHYRPPFELVGGPVDRVGLKIHWVERISGHGDTLFSPPQGGDGCYQVPVGSRIMLDGTPKGRDCGDWTRGQCNYDVGPRWHQSNGDAFWDSPKDDNGFLMRLKPKSAGTTYVFVKVDDIESNALCFTAQ